MYTPFAKDTHILPFLRRKRDAALGQSLPVKQFDTGSSLNQNEPQDEAFDDHGLLEAAKDLCKALESKDYNGVASAFKAAFQILESQPHNEYPHDEQEENY